MSNIDIRDISASERTGPAGDPRLGCGGQGSLPPGSTTVEVVLTPGGPDKAVELFHHEWPSGQ